MRIATRRRMAQERDQPTEYLGLAAGRADGGPPSALGCCLMLGTPAQWSRGPQRVAPAHLPERRRTAPRFVACRRAGVGLAQADGVFTDTHRLVRQRWTPQQEVRCKSRAPHLGTAPANLSSAGMATSRTRSGAQHRSTGEFFVVAIFHHRDERLRDGLVGSGPVGLLSHLH
jgi:hypothetical protein